MSETGEIIKSGAFDKLADIAQKLAGPLAKEVGLMMAESVRVYRLKNWVSVVRRTEKILEDAALPPNAVPPRMFLPILEAASVEGDENLQGLWAGLLASASEKADSLSPAFIETLKQLKPSEARALQLIFLQAEQQLSFDLGTKFTFEMCLQEIMSSHYDANMTGETLERLGIIRRRYDLEDPPPANIYQLYIDGLIREKNSYTNLLYPAGLGPTETGKALPQLTYSLEFTVYGIAFMTACLGPREVSTSIQDTAAGES